jgi:hypothetical protein
MRLLFLLDQTRFCSNGELENLWVSEKHDTATGKKLFIDMITNVNELSNVLVENISEDTSMYFGGDSINGNAEELRAFYKQEYSHLDKENREEIVQAALLISRLTQLHVARYVLPQLKKLTAPLIAFFHALELDLSNRSLQKRQSLSFALTWI